MRTAFAIRQVFAAIGVALAMADMACAQTRQYLDLPKLFVDMRGYCMADVCAGMSLDELRNVPGSSLSLDRPIVEDRLCNSRMQQNVNGTFIGRDGTSFDVAFYMFPGAGTAKDVFRVVLVNLTLHGVGESDFKKLYKPLIDRYKLSQRMLDFGPTWYGHRSMIEVSLRAEQFAEPVELVSQLKLVVAPVGAFALIANEPWCIGDPLPPLPAPPPPLPKL